jgi:aromatic ring-opening dioxygenase catalytic subunit (LigB family)
MLNYDVLSKKPSVFKYFSGLEVHEFDALNLKAKELTPEQKSFNKRLSKERVVAEHTISRLKKFRIWPEEFRNRLKHYDTMTNIVCGLVNFRIAGTTAI